MPDTAITRLAYRSAILLGNAVVAPRRVRAVAMLILLWTAADLSNASVCALDNEGSGTFSGGPGALLQSGSARQSPPPAPWQHVDDCFCCSHCVDVQVLSPVPLAMSVAFQHAPVVPAAIRIFGSPLYHPPLASLQ